MSMPEPDVFSELTELGLQDLEMSANNRAANLRKSIIKEIDMWVENVAIASMARWMLRYRRQPKETPEAKDGSLLPE